MSELAIEVKELRKRYGNVEAVAGISFRVARGEIFALLGPNGAGKTTTAEILEGHRERSTGEVRVLGFDPWAHDQAFKERIGIVLQETGVEPYLSVEETVELFCSYYSRPRPVDEVIGLVGLAEQRRMRVSKLSGGQQRRLDVAIGLAGDPDLLFLDEPTTGFDPAARRDAWEMIKGLQSLGKTILLTTHYMEEAEYLADRVAIIRGGAIVAEGTTRSIIAADPTTTIRFRLATGDETLIDGIEGVQRAEDGTVEIETPAPTPVLFELTRRATERRVALIDLSVTRPSLEDMYLLYVGSPQEAQTPQPAGRGRGRR